MLLSKRAADEVCMPSTFYLLIACAYIDPGFLLCYGIKLFIEKYRKTHNCITKIYIS